MTAPRVAAGARGARSSRRLDKTSAQQRVLTWFDEHGRHLAWRRTRDPYATLVAEVMLQQTQTGRVAPTYRDFLERFPTLERLAHAPAMAVIQAWKGLGYNRRAVDLQRTAQALVRDFGGVFPRDPASLRRLPGLGEYSANAIACFAFDAQVPVVDTNVRRVLARTALGRNAEEMPYDKVAVLAAQWLPAGEAYRWNQALMDIGAMICRPARPMCSQCPLRKECSFYARGRHRSPEPRRRTRGEPFEGSRRQARGNIVDHLRRAARDGITLRELAAQMNEGHAGDLAPLLAVLLKLEQEGLAELSVGARKGSPRGVVRLPR